MYKSTFSLLAAICLALLPRIASAQGKTFTGDHYSITFSQSWDTIQTASILGKTGGLGGMATLGATLGDELPDADSISSRIADSLGGDIKKDSSGTLAIDGYDVHWQKFTYDSLPALSEMVSSAMGFPVTLRKGEFRVYYLVSDGVVFSIACMSILGTKPPYSDVESALATLKLTRESGIVPLQGRVRDLWVRNGKLGGGWLQANRVFAVECYDLRGAFLGQATHAAEGAWNLPVSNGEMLVRLKTASGNGMHILVKPQNRTR